MNFSIKDFFSKSEEILNGKVHVLCSENLLLVFKVRATDLSDSSMDRITQPKTYKQNFITYKYVNFSDHSF